MKEFLPHVNNSHTPMVSDPGERHAHSDITAVASRKPILDPQRTGESRN